MRLEELTRAREKHKIQAFPRACGLVEKAAPDSLLRAALREIITGTDTWMTLAAKQGCSVASLRLALKPLGRAVRSERLERNSFPGSSYSRLVVAPDLVRIVRMLDEDCMPVGPATDLEAAAFCEDNLDLLAAFQDYLVRGGYGRDQFYLPLLAALGVYASKRRLASIVQYAGLDPKNPRHRARVRKILRVQSERFGLYEKSAHVYNLVRERRLLLPLTWPRLPLSMRQAILASQPKAEEALYAVFRPFPRVVTR